MQSPHIATYIQELHLEVRSDDNIWIHRNPSFLKAMDQLLRGNRSLEKLTLSGRGWPQQLADPQGFLDGFGRPFISPFVTSLHIKGMHNVPIRMIQECLNLSDLILSGADLECDSRSNPSRHHVPRPRLRRLQYFESHGAIDKLTGKRLTYHPIHLSTLRALTIYTDQIDDILCAQSIIRATNSLEELYLEAQESTSTPPRNLNSTSPLHSFHLPQLNITPIPERLRILRRDPAITLSTDFNVVYRDASCIR